MALVRHRDFGGPSWLWKALEREAELKKQGIARVPHTEESEFDMVVYRTFHALWNSAVMTSEELSLMYPSLYTAAQTWQDGDVTSMRWLIEAMIMTGASDKKIAHQLGKGELPTMVRAYRELFFNVKDNLDKPAWLQQYLWQPGYKSEPELYYVNLGYKMAAHFGGWKILEGMFSASITDPDQQAWFFNVMATSHMKKSLQFGANYARLDVGSKMTVLSDFFANTMKARSGGGGAPEDTDEALTRVAKAVSGCMQVMGLDLKLGSRETIAVDMYTDEETKNGKNG